MGYDLINRHGASARFGAPQWSLAFALAQAFGWDGPGTLPPPGWDAHADGPWGGGYGDNAGQTVTDPDARALAAALRAAAAPNFREVALRCLEERDAFLRRRYPDHAAPDYTDELLERYQARVRDLAEFAGQGSFQIG